MHDFEEGEIILGGYFNCTFTSYGDRSDKKDKAQGSRYSTDFSAPTNQSLRLAERIAPRDYTF